ncbi:MAG: peptidase M50 [Methanomicrobiales archaeon]
MLRLIPKREWRDLAIGWLAVALAFAIMAVHNRGWPVEPVLFLLFFGIALATVGLGFILHELAHKFTAMRFGYWAEFHKDSLMLLAAVLLAALVGVVFAAPGATVIYGAGLTRREEGVISAAGPVTNLVLCVPFFVLMTFTGGIVGQLGTFGFTVNAMIAAFNMLPVSVLDGRKILAWNPAIFAVLIAASFAAVYWALAF